MNCTSRTFLSCILILFILLILAGCEGQKGTSGHIWEWSRGRKLSIKVELVSTGGPGSTSADLTIRNESETEASISPVRVIVWLKGSGKVMDQEIEISNAMMGKNEFTLEQIFRFKAGRVKNIRVYIGPKGPEQEIFTLTQGKATAEAEKEDIKQEVAVEDVPNLEATKPIQDQSAAKSERFVTPVEIPEESAEEDISEKGIEGGIESGIEIGGIVGQAMGEYAGPVRAAGKIKPPKLIKEVEPIYPEIARKAKVEGVVILEVTTDTSGKVIDVKLLRSIPLLDQSAIEAVRQWIYEPVVVDGLPRGIIFTVPVRFNLE